MEAELSEDLPPEPFVEDDGEVDARTRENVPHGFIGSRRPEASSYLGGEYDAARDSYVSLSGRITYLALKAEPPRCFSQPFSEEIAAGEEKAGVADQEAAQER